MLPTPDLGAGTFPLGKRTFEPLPNFADNPIVVTPAKVYNVATSMAGNLIDKTLQIVGVEVGANHQSFNKMSYVVVAFDDVNKGVMPMPVSYLCTMKDGRCVPLSSCAVIAQVVKKLQPAS